MTQKIKIITDSIADIPPELVAKYGIEMVPCYINFEGKSLKDDGEELDREQFYRDLGGFAEYPTTAAPSPILGEELMRKSLEEVDHVISINGASNISGTYNNMRLAAQEVDPERITVINAGNISAGIGLQVLVACELVEQGTSLEELVPIVDSLKHHTHLYGAIYNLETLRKSGRISSVIAGIGSFLQIKPIMTVRGEGVVEVVHRVRTFSRAKSKLVDVLREEGELDRAAIIHIQDEEAALAFQEQAKDILPENTIVVSVKPTSGIHLGVHSIGFVSLRNTWKQ